jgi:hypothetical protein
LGSSWTYRNAANPSDTYTVSVFEKFVFSGFNGQPAVKFGTDSNNYSIVYNDGSSVSSYAVTEQGVTFGTSIGNFTDGTFFNLTTSSCDSPPPECLIENPTNFVLLRMYDNLDPALKSVYGIDPSLTNLVLWATYDGIYPPNSQNSIVESNLGFTIPYAVTHLEWYATGVGKIVDLDIEAASGDIGTRYELIAHNIVAGPVCTQRPTGDLNYDCKVDFQDFALFANSWLECNLDIPQVGTAFPIANTSGREMSASAAFDGTNFLVGIQGDATADQSITAQFVSKTGALVGSRISLGTTGGAPQVGFDGTNYLLAWAEDAEYSTFISGQFVDTSGALVGSRFTIATGTDMETGFPGVIFDGTNCFVTWRNRSTAGNGDTADLFGQFITPSGAKLGSVVSISTAAHGQREPSIAFDAANILAVWADGRNQSACYTDSNGTHCFESDVYGQFITKSGASAAGTLSGNNFLINAGTLPRDNPTGIGFDGTNYLVTFIEQTAFDGPIWEAYGILVTKTGATIGSKFVIGNTATSQKMFPLPTYLGTKYLVTWTDGFGTTSASVKGIYITTSGTSEGSEFTLFSPASSGAVPWLGMVFTGGGVNLAVTDWGIPDMTDPFSVDLYTSADVMGSIITTP